MDLNGHVVDYGGGGGTMSSPLGDFAEVQSIYEPNFDSSITASLFDPHQELFWTGNNEGRLTSYYGMSMSKYTSFRIQSTSADYEQPLDIRMLHSFLNGSVFALTADTLAAYTSFGDNIFTHRETSFQNLQCMHVNLHDRLYLAGFSHLVYDFDVERRRILRQLNIGDEQADCMLIKSSSPPGVNNGLLCTGSSSGQIMLRDPFTLRFVHKFQPHSGSLSDFDVQDNCLVTCGFSLTRTGQLAVDRFLMHYDLRMMRALTPVQLMFEPCFLHYVAPALAHDIAPSASSANSVLAVGSQSACFQFIDANNIMMSALSGFYQAQVPPVPGLATTFSMSSNAQCFAFGHSTGSIHLFTRGDNAQFNEFSEPTLIVEPPQYNHNYVDINDDMTPLSSMSTPLIEPNNQQTLASDWPIREHTAPRYRPTPPISSELLQNARVIHGITSVPNRSELKRNQLFNADYEAYVARLEQAAQSTFTPLALLVNNTHNSNNNNNSDTSENNGTTPSTTTTTTQTAAE